MTTDTNEENEKNYLFVNWPEGYKEYNIDRMSPTNVEKLIDIFETYARHDPNFAFGFTETSTVTPTGRRCLSEDWLYYSYGVNVRQT